MKTLKFEALRKTVTVAVVLMMALCCPSTVLAKSNVTASFNLSPDMEATLDVNPNIRYVYDDIDRLTRVQTLLGETVYEYDDLGNRIGTYHHVPLIVTLLKILGFGKVFTSAAFNISDNTSLDYKSNIVFVNVIPEIGWRVKRILVTLGSAYAKSLSRQKREAGTPVTIDITESRQFELTDDASIEVTFEEDPTGVEQVTDTQLNISYSKADNVFVVEGINPDNYCVLYTSDGKMVDIRQANAEGKARLRAAAQGVYLVQVGKISRKVVTF